MIEPAEAAKNKTKSRAETLYATLANPASRKQAGAGPAA